MKTGIKTVKNASKPKRMPKTKTSVPKNTNIIEIDLTDEDDEALEQPEENSLIEISDSDSDSDFELSDDEEVEVVSSRNTKHTISLTLVEDDQESEAEKALKIHKNRTLTLQYLRKLEMDGITQKSAILETVSKGKFRVASFIKEKYDEESKMKTLKKLISLNSEYKKESADRLLNEEWLDTSTIEAFFNLLEEDYPISVLNSDLAVQADFCDKLKRRERIFLNMQEKLKANRILWPMCDDTHWYLIVMNKRKDGRYEVFCLDSLNTGSNIFIEKAVAFLEAMHPDEESVVAKQEHIQIPQQNNDRDCGASICFWGERTARNKTMPHNKKGECDYSAFRKEIAVRFAQKIHEDETPVKLSSQVKIKRQ